MIHCHQGHHSRGELFGVSSADRDSVASPTSKQVTLIGMSSGMGASDHRCSAGPQAVVRQDPRKILARVGWRATWSHIHPRLCAHPDAMDIAASAALLAGEVFTAVYADQRFVAVVGDHAAALGTWSGAALALRERGALGLVWIDAHMDCHTPETSISGAFHGMPLAGLLGRGPRIFTELGYPGPKLSPDALALVGVRSFEPAEARLLALLGVRIFYMEEIRARDLSNVMDEAVSIAQRAAGGYGISIDLDAVDPADAPGVGTPEPGGITGAALVRVMARHGPGALGLEIAELNPSLDIKGRTAELARDLVVAGVTGRHTCTH